jgi:hypothetical protein
MLKCKNESEVFKLLISCIVLVYLYSHSFFSLRYIHTGRSGEHNEM